MTGVEQSVPVSAPIHSDFAGVGGNEALQSVFRVISRELNSAGTGFLHKSGVILTAEHVVRRTPEPLIVMPDNTVVPADVISSDEELDLAVIKPKSSISAPALDISPSSTFNIGAHVSTWGFPGGYVGLMPMLSVGYLSGMQGVKKPSGKIVRQWVVNAAFNSGNSGGPLVHLETGKVIGVVSSKLAPISPTAQSAIEALKNQQSGFVHVATGPNGKQFNISEGQIVAAVLHELRQQVQLVIGMAALLEDLRVHLKSAGIEP